MARIIYPEDFLRQTVLLQSIKAKHDADGPASVLLAFLTQQGIDLVADTTARTNASTKEGVRMALKTEAEDMREKRDLFFKPVMKHLRDYFQFLKAFYKPNFAEVGYWGANITVTGRIVYPPSFLNRLQMADNFFTKYDSYDPNPTPLDPYLTQHGLTIAADVEQAGFARDSNDLFTQLSAEAEDATQDRNNLWNPVMGHIRKIGGFLIKLYNTNPRELGYYGFIVDESPRAPKQVKSKVLLLGQVTATSLVIGGTFKNIGSIPLTVYKGSTASGEGVVVLPGEMYGIAAGFSTITVKNLSDTETGIFSTLRHL